MIESTKTRGPRIRSTVGPGDGDAPGGGPRGHHGPSASPGRARGRVGLRGRLFGMGVLGGSGLARICWIALALVYACATVRTPKVTPIHPLASEAFAEARMLERIGTREARAEALEAARRAVLLEPSWVAPRRMLDDRMLEDLLGVEALAAHRRALELDPSDAAAEYLAGRLEGAEGSPRFERAARLDPDLSWAQHGLAFHAAQGGDVRRALVFQRRALTLARDSWERSFFTATLARYLEFADRPRDALAVLLARIEDPEVEAADRIELSVQSAQIELSLYFGEESRTGYARGLKLLRECDLTDEEIQSLVLRLRLARPSDDAAALELQLALAARPGAERDRLRAELLLDHRPTPLALGLLARSREGVGYRVGGGPLQRRARFAASQFRLGVEEWLEALPSHTVDGSGLPRDPRLARVVTRARTLPRAPGPEELHAFGDALLDAGWFREARSVAAYLAGVDLDAALDLEGRAASGQTLLHAFRRGIQAIDSGREPGSELSPPVTGGDALDGFLASLEEPLLACTALLGGPREVELLGARLLDSPRQSYGPFASVVHPGPRFSRDDQDSELGPEGEAVPGLAELFDRLGRFGLFGQVSGGGGPDGTILQRLWIESRSGRHLKTPWHGTIAWCEGADLRSRAGRQGAIIAGAALHEGYWIDVEVVRRELEGWRRLETEFAEEQDRARLIRALRSRGLALMAHEMHDARRSAERRSISAMLGAGDRMRLAVIADRIEERERGEREGALVELEELVLATSTHEEGHLCDRTRFLPLSSNKARILGFAFRNSFSPTRIAQRLEYRAQLIAICEVEDPRVPLSEVLRAVEIGGELTPHAAGYRMLLQDLLKWLDRELTRHPEAWPELDVNHRLVHQLHWIAPERLRALARNLAEREGLVGG